MMATMTICCISMAACSLEGIIGNLGANIAFLALSGVGLGFQYCISMVEECVDLVVKVQIPYMGFILEATNHNN